MYPPCTSLRRFCGFSPFCFFVESVSYVVSIPPRGSTPTLGTSLCILSVDGSAFPRSLATRFCLDKNTSIYSCSSIRTPSECSWRNRTQLLAAFWLAALQFIVQGALTIMFGIFRSRSMALKAGTSVAMSCCISCCEALPCFFNSACTALCCVVGGKSEEPLTSTAR